MAKPRHTASTYGNAQLEGDHDEAQAGQQEVVPPPEDPTIPAWWVRTFGIGVPYEPPHEEPPPVVEE